VKTAFSHAASAVVADFRIDLHHAVRKGRGSHGTCGDHGTFSAAVAGVLVIVGNQLADNSQIVQIRLHTVVGTSADRDFRLVGKLHGVIAQIKSLVNLLGQIKGINQSVLAGGSLAGYHRAHHGTGSSGDQAFFGDKLLELFDFVKG